VNERRLIFLSVFQGYGQALRYAARFSRPFYAFRPPPARPPNPTPRAPTPIAIASSDSTRTISTSFSSQTAVPEALAAVGSIPATPALIASALSSTPLINTATNTPAGGNLSTYVPEITEDVPGSAAFFAVTSERSTLTLHAHSRPLAPTHTHTHTRTRARTHTSAHSGPSPTFFFSSALRPPLHPSSPHHASPAVCPKPQRPSRCSRRPTSRRLPLSPISMCTPAPARLRAVAVLLIALVGVARGRLGRYTPRGGTCINRGRSWRVLRLAGKPRPKHCAEGEVDWFGFVLC
jgi:hypothetical protein